MQLTLYTDYSLRVLIYLGLYPDRLVTINEIAESYHISRNHLVKVVHHLGQVGFIKTVRGKGGGMRLAHPPEEINLGAVVRSTETNFDLVECFDMEKNTCPIEPACAFKGMLAEASARFLEVLDSYTLAPVLGAAPRLKVLLKLPEPTDSSD